METSGRQWSMVRRGGLRRLEQGAPWTTTHTLQGAESSGYVRGVRVTADDGLLFSYNATRLTPPARLRCFSEAVAPTSPRCRLLSCTGSGLDTATWQDLDGRCPGKQTSPFAALQGGQIG